MGTEGRGNKVLVTVNHRPFADSEVRQAATKHLRKCSFVGSWPDLKPVDQRERKKQLLQITLPTKHLNAKEY